MTPSPNPPLVFVDLETTGANPQIDRITEVGIVELGDQGIREWSSLVNPEQPISDYIERLTGISNEMVAGAPTFGRIAEEVLHRLKGRLFVAHNARFDYGFLKHEFSRLGIDFRANVLCTVKLSRRLFPEHHRHSLDAIIERHGLPVTGRHRALADARLLREFWRHIHEVLPSATITAAMDHILARPTLPPQLDAAFVDDLPEGPGVYVFHGEADQVLYLARSTNLRHGVLGHFTAGGKRAIDRTLAETVRRVSWHETSGEFGAQLVEARLVKALDPLHNRLHRAGEDLCAWRLVNRGGGDFRPVLVRPDEADFGRDPDLFGPFGSPKEAMRALRALADAHQLCHAILGLEKRPEGKACSAYASKTCRGVCVGREDVAKHGARLLAAIARIGFKPWPYRGPVAIVESDTFGIRTEFHLVDAWRHLGTFRDEASLRAAHDELPRPPFDEDVYRIVRKHLGSGKAKIVALPGRAAP